MLWLRQYLKNIHLRDWSEKKKSTLMSAKNPPNMDVYLSPPK